MKRLRRIRPTWSTTLTALAVLAMSYGCETIEDLAPPVGHSTLQLAASRGVSAERVMRGREIYVTNCARCHSPEPVRRYTVDDWEGILPRMSQRSKLARQDAGALQEYVVLTLEAVDPKAAPP